MTTDTSLNTNPEPAHESCARCSYDLDGLPHDANCPECGERRLPLDAFLLCPHCGYHLAGLPRDASCPECGNPASDAYVEYPLYRAGAHYIDRVASGARLIRTAIFMFAGAWLMMFAIGLVMPLIVRGTGGMAAGVGGFLVYALAFFALIFSSTIVWFIGAIRATARDPVYKQRAPSEASRSASRSLAIGLFCMQFAVILPLVNIIVTFAILICAAVMYFTATTYIAHLGRRIPSPKLIRTAMRSRTAGVWLMPAILFCFFAVWIDASVSNGNASDLAEILMVLGWVLAFAIFVVYFWLVWRFARVMKLCRQRVIDLPRHAIPRPPTPITPGAPS